VPDAAQRISAGHAAVFEAAAGEAAATAHQFRLVDS